MRFYRTTHKEYRDRLSTFIKPTDEHQPIMWSFKPRLAFNDYDLFLKRLYEIQQMFITGNEFMKLEKVEIGGIKGRQISRNIFQV